ncbi:MAG: hypothetical protein M3170_01745 [Candidatus Dormibacteraeota bacterium]|nr:hypothetical protein [Candidatus Dormibacteraeota bacterium]MDQ6920304.1 hypothetical protein [Candidatus Dormibacteraeota bacterium]
MATWLAGFGRFWYRFIVGDDWLLAVGIVLGLVAVYGLLRAGYQAWWLMPIVVVAAMALSLWRGRGTPP